MLRSSHSESSDRSALATPSASGHRRSTPRCRSAARPAEQTQHDQRRRAPGAAGPAGWRRTGDQVRDAQRRDEARGKLDARTLGRQRPPGRAGSVGAGDHRPVQLRLGGGAGPDHQRGGRAVVSPATRTSGSRAGAPARSRASRTSTTRRASARSSAYMPDDRRPGRRARHRDARRRLQARRRRPRRQGLRQGRGDARCGARSRASA